MFFEDFYFKVDVGMILFGVVKVFVVFIKIDFGLFVCVFKCVLDEFVDFWCWWVMWFDVIVDPIGVVMV